MLTIRPADPGDAADIINLANALNRYEGKPDTPLTVERFLESAYGSDPWFQCLIAEREDRAIGYAAYSRGFDIESGNRGLYLIDLFVIAEERRRGVGRALMARIARIALDLGCAYVEWNVMCRNKEAQAFYRVIGGAEEEVATFSMGTVELRSLAKRDAEQF